MDLAKVREKYPQYSDMSDADLSAAILKKYPQYGDVLGPEGQLAQQAGPRGYTLAGQAKKPGDEPGFIRQVVSDMTSPTGVGAALGTAVGGKAAADEEGGAIPNWLKPVLGAGAGAAVGAIGERKDPATAALGGAVGEMGGAGISKALSPFTGRALFNMGKYVGKVGSKLEEYFKFPTPIRTELDIYNALHYDPNKSVFDSRAGDAAKSAYGAARQKINSLIGEGAQITGDAAKQLREILYNNSPKFKQAVENLTSRGASKENAALKDTVRAAMFSEPMGANEAMELAIDLGQQAAKKGGAAQKENQMFRKILAESLNQLPHVPGAVEKAGDVYAPMNAEYSRAMTVLRSFDAEKLFKTGKGGAKLNRPELIRQSNAAEKSLGEVGADIDPIIRFGKPPGFTSSTFALGGSGHIPGSAGFIRAHLPRREFEIGPLLPEKDIAQKLLDAVLRSTGAYTGAEMGK